MASLLTVLSLNTNKVADLGGLYSILKETKAHLFLLRTSSSKSEMSLTTRSVKTLSRPRGSRI